MFNIQGTLAKQYWEGATLLLISLAHFVMVHYESDLITRKHIEED